MLKYFSLYLKKQIVIYMIQFNFKPFNEMRDEDYALIGFKSGLEIHQQLKTQKKLFCRCPAGKYSDKYDAEILRHMRPTLSELGEYDGTALMEFKTKKEIIYRIHHDTVCTYEMDDTPPFELNEEALDIALEIALLYKCNLVDELHISRKQYLDGSIPAGFQRTTIVAVNGFIPYKKREIGIVQVGLEEDACREVSDIYHQRVYLTDRLGMPLTETVTTPELKSPIEVSEVAEIIRRLARSTGKVRTGLGAARQDVNVSVDGGTRIEIKGVSRIQKIPILTYNEAMRQWNLLRIKEELNKRGITFHNVYYKNDDVTKIVRKTRYQPINLAVQEGKKVYGVLLQGFKGLLRWQTQTDTYFSKEFSDRVRVIACLTTLPNIIHSDSPTENLSTLEWQNIRKFLNATEDDTIVLVWGNEEDVKTAVKEIQIRAKEATIGVPSETRQALIDGTNGFERILPGPERMYPDTDLPPKAITNERVQKIKLQMPLAYWEVENQFEKYKLKDYQIKKLSITKYGNLFKKIVEEYNVDKEFVANILVDQLTALERKDYDISKLSDNDFIKIFTTYKKGEITKKGVVITINNILKKGLSVDEAFPKKIDEYDMNQIMNKEYKLLLAGIIYNKKNIPSLLLGKIMNYYNGRIDGSVIKQKVYDFLKDYGYDSE
jgi:glutamyl-tRNA(Gln) amidotransferase subunit E